MTMKVLGVEFAPLSVPLKRRQQTFGVMAYFYIFFIAPFVSMALMVMLFFVCFPLVFIYAIWFMWDYRTPSRGSYPNKWLRNWVVWHWMRDYFPVELVKSADLDPGRNYIFGCHPHGIVGCAAFVNFCTEATGFSRLFPGISPHLCTLVGNFSVPFRREFIMALGAISVSRDSIEYVLSQKDSGHAVIIVIGGADEALDAHPGNYQLKLANRRGFVREALKLGADLVPVYSFGENDLFMQVDNPHGSLLRRFQTKAKNLLGFSPPLFHGRGIFTYNFGLMPFRKPIRTVVGKPIRVEKNENATVEEIADLHQLYMDSLSELFEDNKEKFGIPQDGHLSFH